MAGGSTDEQVIGQTVSSSEYHVALGTMSSQEHQSDLISNYEAFLGPRSRRR